MLSPWIISVLSTDYDLHEHRTSIISVLNEHKACVSAFELPNFPAEPYEHSHDACLTALKRTDISLLIIDKRYGGIYYGDTNISITEKEFFATVNMKNPILVFISNGAWQERYSYKQELKKSKKSAKEFDEQYVCKYVDDVKVIHFIDTIQKVNENYDCSNWMSFFNSIDDLKTKIIGKLNGLTRYYLNKIVNLQAARVKSRKTTTGLSMALGDVLERGYYIKPSYNVSSGSLNDSMTELDENIVNSLMKNNSILVVGEAGCGKTTILAKSFLNHLYMLNSDPDYKIPFYIWLKGKSKGDKFIFKDYIKECFEEYLNKEIFPFVNLESIRPYFYIDGFDELTEKLELGEVISIATSEIFKYPVLLTCRKQFANRYINNTDFLNKFNIIIDIKEWDESQANLYISNFCSKQGKDSKFYERISVLISDNKDLKSILNNPLLITMLLWIVESKKLNIPETIHTRVELFDECLKELAKRELTRLKIRNVNASELVSEWAFFAWELYYHKLRNAYIKVDTILGNLASEHVKIINRDQFISSLEAIFDIVGNNVYGTFHEQFLEFLVAYAIFNACAKKIYPYPEFLKFVIRPEINRYFRAMWNESTKDIKNVIVNNLWDQYLQNLFVDADASIIKRVHAIYHLTRFKTDNQMQLIEKAFSTEQNISVLLSLYFGVIKLGHLDYEKKFYEILSKDANYNLANRGYHLMYYSDSMMSETLPFIDNGKDNWTGTLAAFIRHFSSEKLEHYFLRRIDLVTMKQLIEARASVAPLTENALKFFSEKVYNFSYGQYADFQKSIEAAYLDLEKTFNAIKR